MVLVMSFPIQYDCLNITPVQADNKNISEALTTDKNSNIYHGCCLLHQTTDAPLSAGRQINEENTLNSLNSTIPLILALFNNTGSFDSLQLTELHS